MKPLDEVFRRMGRDYWPKSFDDDRPVRAGHRTYPRPVPVDEYPRPYHTPSLEDDSDVSQD